MACSSDRDHDQILGFVISRVLGGQKGEKDAECEILNIAVSPQCRSKRIGGQMIARLITSKWVQQVSIHFIWRFEKATRSRSGFTKQTDFGRLVKEAKYYKKPVEDAIVMKKFVEAGDRGN